MELIKPIADYGVTIVATAILFWYVKKMTDTQITEMKNISKEIKRMADKMNKTQLTNTPGAVIREFAMGDTLEKMMGILANILVSNDLQNRQEQIKETVTTLFEATMQKNKRNLHYFVLYNGYNLSKGIQYQSLELCFTKIFEIVFNDEPNYMKKLIDCRQILGGYVNKLRTSFISEIE